MALFATFKTSMGDIRIELKPETAPKTVDNFVGLATGKREWKDPKSGQKRSDSLYAGTIFHRVIPNFMIQGGDPLGTGTGGPGYTFEDEPSGHPVARGALAMANAGPNTNGSQFFIVTADACPWLDGKHTVFGQVASGQDVVDRISLVDRDGRDMPTTPVTIDRIELA